MFFPQPFDCTLKEEAICAFNFYFLTCNPSFQAGFDAPVMSQIHLNNSLLWRNIALNLPLKP